MGERSIWSFESGVWLRVSRPEMLLILGTLTFGAVFGLGIVAFVQPELMTSLAVLIVVAFAFNLALLWCDRRGLSERVFTWMVRLGNLVFLTAAVYLTGGFSSSIFSLYTIYIVVASLSYGWKGTVRSCALCLVSWVSLAVLAPPDGIRGWVLAAVSAASLLAVALIVGLLAQRHIDFQAQAARRDREMTFLREAGRAMGASLDPQEVLAVTLARVNELLDVEAASLALVNRETGRIQFELAVGGGDEAIHGLEMEPGQGIVGRVIAEGQPILVPDVAIDPRWYAGVDQQSGYRTRSLLCVPLRVKGQIIGALEVMNKRDGVLTEQDQRLLSSLADLAGQSLENARLYTEVQQHVRRLQQAYEEVQKLDELKSAFIRNVSHELRTPLALIAGYVDLLLDGQFGALQAEQRQSLSLVAEKAGQLTDMVDDIISLQTIGALGFELELLPLGRIVEYALEGAQPKAERGQIQLAFDCPPGEALPLVRGDARRLRQVFDHLLDNAIKFSPSGGTVRINLSCEGDMVCARVQDEGIGVPTDQLERVFERFYQVDGSATRRYGGTGLGLALVKEVVEAHGGAVWVESEGIAGQGSTFSVFLPVCQRPAAM